MNLLLEHDEYHHCHLYTHKVVKMHASMLDEKSMFSRALL